LFKKYNSQGNNLHCSYLSVGEQYENELVVIAREPAWWPEDFSVEELNKRGEEDIFRTKVYHHSIYGYNSLCPLKYVTDLWGDTEIRKEYGTTFNTRIDPLWSCIKEVVMKLGICKDQTNWASSIALTYLYKIAFSDGRYLPDKSRKLQFEHCREMLHLELSNIKPKRILFLTGMKHAQDFLYLSDCSGLEDCVCPLGYFNYEFDKIKTVVSVHPKKYNRKVLVDLILKGFK
ncbi:MAG: hypothetical protein P4L35_18635, partial [Ignavibacteriaceae bacterium]|nr:hypothetical protein [Ignavibacteriaceae bacterium]